MGTTSERARRGRVRMTSAERREQLISVARGLFAARGFDGTSVEEIASHAGVSKPVVYEHFGGKEGLYAVIVDRDVRAMLDAIRVALTTPNIGPRQVTERAALAFLDCVESNPDGFRIIARDSPLGTEGGSFATILTDIANRVEDLLAAELRSRDFNPKFAALYAQALVGMIAVSGQWWLEEGKPSKREVAVHLVNLAWNGLGNLAHDPDLETETERR